MSTQQELIEIQQQEQEIAEMKKSLYLLEHPPAPEVAELIDEDRYPGPLATLKNAIAKITEFKDEGEDAAKKEVIKTTREAIKRSESELKSMKTAYAKTESEANKAHAELMEIGRELAQSIEDAKKHYAKLLERQEDLNRTTPLWKFHRGFINVHRDVKNGRLTAKFPIVDVKHGRISIRPWG